MYQDHPFIQTYGKEEGKLHLIDWLTVSFLITLLTFIQCFQSHKPNYERQFHKKLNLTAPTKIYVEITVAILYLDKLDYSIWDCCFAESSEIFNDITCLEQKEQKN